MDRNVYSGHFISGVVHYYQQLTKGAIMPNTVSTEYLGKALQFSEHKKFNVKCEIYCRNHDIDLEQYRRGGRGSMTYKRIYDLPIPLAVGIVENVRMSNPNRAKVLEELYALLGGKVVTQHHARREIVFFDLLKDVLNELGIALIHQYSILSNKYCLDGYIPSHKIAIEYDEFHHKDYQEQDKKREQEIIDHLGCTVIRLKEEDSVGTNAGKVIQHIRN